MTALALHTALSIVVVAWGYMVASRVAYRPAWIWTGVATLVLVGYLSVLATFVFDGSPSTVRVIVGKVAATLMALAGVFCLVLFAAVSRGANRPVAARGARAPSSSDWGPEEEEPVIVADDWEPSSLIDVGSSPPGVGATPRAGRYAFPLPETPATTLARPSGSTPDASVGTAPASRREAVAPPSTDAPSRAASVDGYTGGRSAPRRALPPSGDDES